MARIPGQFVPLDVNYPRDRAIRRAGQDAELLFIRSIVFAKGSGTDGFIGDYDLDAVAVGLRGVTKSVAALVRVGLWEVVEDGWQVRSFGKWNMTTDEISEVKTAKKKGGISGNHQRWHVEKGVFNEDCPLCVEDRSTDRITDRSCESDSDQTRIAEIEREVEGERDKRGGRFAPPPSSHQREAREEARELETVSPETVFPKSWRPSTRHQAYAMEHALSIQDEALGFAAHAKANGRTAVDWDAAFMGWLIKSKKNPTAGRPLRSTTDERVQAGIDLTRQLAAEEAAQTRKEIGA